MDTFPERIVRNIHEVHGSAGAEWIARLPTIIESCAERWSLGIAAPYEEGLYSFVAPARRTDGARVVVKICFPDRGFNQEAEALRLFDGLGAVRLLDADLDRGALLLERLEPGTPLSRLDDDRQATSIAAPR